MAIAFVCDCGRRLRVADEKAGRKIRCPDCSDIQVVPEASPAPPAASRKKPRRAAAEPSRLPPSRPAKKEKSKPANKKKKRFSPKERVIVLVLAGIIFAIPAWLRSQRPNQRPEQNNTANSEKPAPLSPREEVLKLETSIYVGAPLDAERSVRVLAKIDPGDYRGIVAELTELAGKTVRTKFRSAHGFLLADLVGPEFKTIAEGIQFGTIVKADAETRMILVEGRKAHR